MTYYRYHLARWNERSKDVKCPNCGRGKGAYKEYVDDAGNPVDPEHHLCGKCDSEKRCGYHLPPSEYEKQHGRLIVANVPRREARQTERIEIPREIVKQTIRRDCYNINTLVTWLRSLPWNSAQAMKLEHALQLYCIGTMKNGSVIFWQIDQDLVIRTGKKMQYSTQGKRLKDKEGNPIGFGFMHNIIPETRDKLKAGTHAYLQCAFGLHLAHVFQEAELHVVESEKTALIMAAYDPAPWNQHIWIATGSMQQLQPQWMEGMKNRKIVCYPDANAVDNWWERVGRMKRDGWHIFLSIEWLDKWNVKEDPKADIGDLVIKRISSPKD